MKAVFRGTPVFAEVDASGAPVVEGGRVRVRYRDDDGAREYRAGASAVVVGGRPAAAPRGGSGRSSPSAGFGRASDRSEAQAGLARQDARSFLNSLPPGTVVVYTDGACSGNPGPAASAAVLEGPGGRREAVLSLGSGTNQQAELAALLLGLDLLDAAGVPAGAAAVLLTDSRYAEGMAVRGWKARAHVGLVQKLRARLAARPGVRVRWVAGHAGIPGNERVDALAEEAARAGP